MGAVKTLFTYNPVAGFVASRSKELVYDTIKEYIAWVGNIADRSHTKVLSPNVADL